MLPGYLGRECLSGQGDSAPGKGSTEVAQERDTSNGRRRSIDRCWQQGQPRSIQIRLSTPNCWRRSVLDAARYLLVTQVPGQHHADDDAVCRAAVRSL